MSHPAVVPVGRPAVVDELPLNRGSTLRSSVAAMPRLRWTPKKVSRAVQHTWNHHLLPATRTEVSSAPATGPSARASREVVDEGSETVGGFAAERGQEPGGDGHA